MDELIYDLSKCTRSYISRDAGGYAVDGADLAGG
jgi:hypothetical protein